MFDLDFQGQLWKLGDVSHFDIPNSKNEHVSRIQPTQ